MKVVSKILRKTADLLYRVERKIVPPVSPPPTIPSKQSIRVIPWFNDNGDKTHRLNYDLNESSIVFDLGGYEGQWASDIFSKYVCTIHVFEPYHQYAQNIQERFKRNGKIHVHWFGLAQNSNSSKLSISADASSMFKSSGDVIDIQMMEASEFISKNGFETIDLIKINIEGGEYDLLEHLIEKGIVARIDNLQVQFHDFVEDAENRMRAIQAKLSNTHYLTYQYEFVWENWARKK